MYYMLFFAKLSAQLDDYSELDSLINSFSITTLYNIASIFYEKEKIFYKDY